MVVNKIVELIIRTINSANQLSIHGAAADMCREVSKDTMASVKPEAHDPFGVERNSYWRPAVIQNSALTLVWKLSKEDNFSSHLMQKDQAEWHTYADNTRCFLTIWELEREAGFVGIRKLAQSRTFMFLFMKVVRVLKLRSDLCFKTEQLPGFALHWRRRTWSFCKEYISSYRKSQKKWLRDYT